VEANGHRAVVAPIMQPRTLAWDWPEAAFDALLLTSPRALGDARAPTHLAAVPVHAVGPATAEAARRAGFGDVREGPGGGGQRLLDTLEPPPARLLWLAARDRTALVPPPGTALTIVENYAVDPVALGAQALALLRAGEIDRVLLHSARIAAHFAFLIDRAAVARATVALGALSQAVADAAGAGWRNVRVAMRADDPALLHACGLMAPGYGAVDDPAGG